MRSIFRFTLSSVILLTVIFIPLASAAVGIFSQKWGLPISIVPITSIAPHALDVVGQIVYFGSSVTTGFTNYLYACNVSNGNLVWQYNTSIPVNYVSHFNNGKDFVVVGTGGSTTRIGESYVYSFNLLENVTQWNSPNLNSSVTTVAASQSYVTTGEDIVAGLDNGTVIRLRGDNGAVLWSYSCLGSVFSVTELRNGSVVVGTREIPNKGYIYCLNSDGSLRWGPISKQNNILTLVRKFADVNGDGEPEIVAVFNDGLIHVYDGKTGAEVSPPWPFEIDNSGDNVKDLLCTEDYTGDGFPDLIFGTDYGNLTIVNGLTAQPFLGPVSVGATVSYIQYMYSYQSGFVYSNKTLAVSLLDNDYVSYYIRGYNTTDLTPMKQYSIASRGQNLFNVANYTVDFTGDLIFTVNNVVYCISGDELVVPELSTQAILAILIVLALFLVINLRPRRLKPNPKSRRP